jgi:broad specificity phosphatase PhoE
MSLLILVRHGQASFGGDVYDHLSPLGAEQTRALGDAWAEMDLRFDHVYVGPLRRHRQTHDAAAEAYQSHGLCWPEPLVLAQLDEHQGMAVLEQRLPLLIDQDRTVRGLVERHRRGEKDAGRAYLKLFQQVTRQWVHGELDIPNLEPWPLFRQRVTDGLQQIMREHGGGKTVVAFTSGGVIAAAMGVALGLDDAQIVELSWIVRNSSCTEFLFSQDRWSLHVFNATPHLARADMLTYV